MELQEVELLHNRGAGEEILTMSGGSKQLAHWCFLAKRYNKVSPVTCRAYLKLRAKQQVEKMLRFLLSLKRLVEPFH